MVSTNKSKDTLNKYTELWDKIKDLIKLITDASSDCDERYKKIIFNSDDNLPLNKILKLHNLIMVVRSVFQEDERYIAHKFSYISVCMNCKC